MKKLIMAAAIVCVATIANAASMAWGITSVTASPDAAAAAGWKAYFMDGSTYAAFTALAPDAVAAYVTANSLYETSTAAGRTGVNASATSGSYSAGANVSGYMVIFNNATPASATYYANTVSETQQVPGAGNLQFTRDFATETTGWQSTSAVPEPTSGLLMLVGLGALALRRRKA